MKISNKQIEFFEEEGFLVIENLLSPDEIEYYSQVYNAFLDNKVDTKKYRSDLSGIDTNDNVEKITQIMLPSKLLPDLLHQPLHLKSLQVAQELLGVDMHLDFDMLINKAPHTNAITPWHQDAAYWIDMPDKRAVSCWVAIDPAYKDNGCMWYTPKSHLGTILSHVQIGNKGALECKGSEEKSICVELAPGSCVLHHGATLHYSRGNSTSKNRRAFITNFRPAAMIDLERAKGVDHTGERKLNIYKSQ